MDMNKDKAIIKALESQVNPMLSAGFNQLLMGKLCAAVEKKRKRMYILTLCLLSTVSAGLILMGVFLMKDYLPSGYTFQIPTFHNLIESLPRYGFGFYIAFLILVLIGLDAYFRQLLHKKKSHKSNPSR